MAYSYNDYNDIFRSLAIIIVYSLLGLIPAFIAKNKGKNFITWWIYGTLLFPIALVHSLVSKNAIVEQEKINMINKNIRENNERFQKRIKNAKAPEQLLKFKQLLDEGAITQEEFEEKKKELLS